MERIYSSLVCRHSLLFSYFIIAMEPQGQALCMSEKYNLVEKKLLVFIIFELVITVWFNQLLRERNRF